MLQALMAGVALPASELAYQAGVSNATASSHLKLLVETGMLRVVQTGRHRYYELAGHGIAELIEKLSVVAPNRPVERRRITPHGLRCARMCYDHLAGSLGVSVTDTLLATSAIERQADDFIVSDDGWILLSKIGVSRDQCLCRSRRSLARVCVDWSERRPHIAGILGAQIAERFIDLDWVRRNRDDRSLVVTETGILGLSKWLSLDFGLSADHSDVTGG